ncbi:ALF repeat-containing protein [Streptomyces sp. URMC 125]|uniref:ALF repeat-containing protein n=1 Tax=Streptomyces sp. URMC 125 TaxID=3423419 RepID=UPI003F1CD241
MRPTRATLLVAVTALTPALLLTAPAFAADPTAAPTTATATTTAPEKPVDEMSEEELRIAILRILADEDSGRGVTREANEALDGTAEDMREFLRTGYRLAQAEDDRVAIARILADPTISDALLKAAEEAIDGTPEELRYFLETGRYEVDA